MASCWRIYYGDGSTFSHEDGSPFAAPPAGVQVVSQQLDGQERELMHGKDYYYWRDDIGWNGCDLGGLWDYLLIGTGPKYVLAGRSVRNDVFWSIVGKAAKEPL
jgi:hypothetical protein